MFGIGVSYLGWSRTGKKKKELRNVWRRNWGEGEGKKAALGTDCLTSKKIHEAEHGHGNLKSQREPEKKKTGKGGGKRPDFRLPPTKKTLKEQRKKNQEPQLK